MSIEIQEVTQLTDELVDSIQRMLPQLSPLAAELNHDELAQIVSAPCCTLFAAHDASQGEMVGTLILVVFRGLTGIKARIEDVVVDKRARGQGIGTALIQKALTHAASLQVHTIELTSRPSRTTANSLYQRLGFVQRDTNVYCYEIG
jgi:ribosomal protein S18 acetylase RimI-like enzyme